MRTQTLREAATIAGLPGYEGLPVGINPTEHVHDFGMLGVCVHPGCAATDDTYPASEPDS